MANKEEEEKRMREFPAPDKMTEAFCRTYRQQAEIKKIASQIKPDEKIEELMSKKQVKEITEDVKIHNKQSNYIFDISQKLHDFKFQQTWTKRNSKNAQVMLATLEVESKWFHSDIFICSTKELELKLKRIGFKEVDPKTESSKILKDFGIILHNWEYNIAFHLIDEKFMSILDMALSIVKGSASGFHNDNAVFVSTISVLSKTL